MAVEGKKGEETWDSDDTMKLLHQTHNIYPQLSFMSK